MTSCPTKGSGFPSSVVTKSVHKWFNVGQNKSHAKGAVAPGGRTHLHWTSMFSSRHVRKRAKGPLPQLCRSKGVVTIDCAENMLRMPWIFVLDPSRPSSSRFGPEPSNTPHTPASSTFEEMEFEGFCSWLPATVTWSLRLFLSLTSAVPQCKPSGRDNRRSFSMRMPRRCPLAHVHDEVPARGPRPHPLAKACRGTSLCVARNFIVSWAELKTPDMLSEH